MQNKVTLITPPDFFENEAYSILFVHLSDEDQSRVSKWLAEADISENLNIYFYDHDIEIPWLLYTMNLCEYKFIDLDRLRLSTQILSGHLLSKKNTYYRISDESASQVCHYINQNRITNIESFLERAFNDKIRRKSQV